MLNTEMAVVGCMMIEPSLIDKARVLISPKMFEEEALARLYSCMLKLKKRGMPVDPVTVMDKLGDGYGRLIEDCAACTPSLESFERYAVLLLNDWRKRTLTVKLQELALSGRSADELTAELERLAAKQRRIMACIQAPAEKGFLQAAGEAYTDLYRPDTSLRTGWTDFDNRLGGLQRGELYVIAARPGDGKTDFALYLAVQLAKQYSVRYDSLEMAVNQLTQRILSRACVINSKKFLDKTVEEKEQKRISLAVDQMKDLRLVMDDTPGLTVEDVENQCAGKRPDALFIDYLGLMKGDPSGKKPLWQVTGEITHELKAIAKRHGVVIVCLVQLGRAADRSASPALSDLKGGSDIEADAGGVIFMKPDKTEEFLTGGESWPVEVILAKNRNGGTGTLRLYWQPQYHRYLSAREVQ